jgi:UrcA family protein
MTTRDSPEIPIKAPYKLEKIMNTSTAITSMRRLVVAAAVSALSLGFSVASHAAGGLDERTVTVEFASASATTPQGASTLYRRIRGAAEDICSVLDHGDLSSKRIFRACVRMTIEGAVGKVNRQALTAAYDADYPAVPTEQFLAAQSR